ncbi:hypothetical protein F5B17DRAFT_444992 [Nemania serpens]|nr:hypothetical protein F5B17DRAFT_444992 [Nemania serpens]
MNGTRYLASFSNKPSLNAKLILNAEKAADVHYMYVVEDHLGIQQVCFANSAPPIPHGHLEGLWWRMFSLRGKREFRIHTDGFKIRHLECLLGNRTSRLLKKVAWLTLEIELELMRFEILKLESLEQLRMAPFNCNDSRNTAYSVCWDWGLIHLHAHVDNESLSFYNLVPQGRHAICR